MQEFVARGAFGDVFRREDRAIKVFRWPKDMTGNRTADLRLVDRSRRVFRAERDGFLITSRSPTLRTHTPDFFGPVRIADIVDERGRSLAPFYLLDCAYSMSFVEGTAQDVLPACYQSYPHVATFIAEMNAMGVGRTDDMIGWCLDNPSHFVLPDFATYDAAYLADLETESMGEWISVPASPEPHGTHERDRS
jgi:hypothetical protein